MDIGLYIVAALITAVELFSSEKPFHSRKIRTIAIIFFLFIGLCVTWMKDRKTQKSDKKKDEQIASLKEDLKEKTDSIIISQIYLTTGTDYLRNKIDTLVTSQLKSLDSMLHSVEEQTLLAIKERKENIKAFNNVSDQLKKQVGNEQIEIYSKGPQVEILTKDVRWVQSEDASKYKLSVGFKNLGKRTASNFTYEGIILFCDKHGEIIKHFVIPRYRKNSSYVYPFSEDGYSLELTTCKIEKWKIDLLHKSGFLLLNIRYDDLAVNNSANKYKNFFWTDYGQTIRAYQGGIGAEIKQYIRKRRLTGLIDVKF